MDNKFLTLAHPRYWPTWIGLGFLYMLTKLPYSSQLKLGKNLGRVSYYFLGKFRLIAQLNIRLCFPNLTPIEQKNLVKKHFQSLGMGLVESAIAWWTPYHKIKSLIKIKGLEHLQTALRKKKGVLLLSGHFTSLDICGRLFSSLFPLGVVYREQKNKVIDMFLKKHRHSPSMHPIPRQAIRQIIKTLKQNKAIWYAADQDYGLNHSIFSSFFNIPTATITTPSRYARRTGAQVIVLFYHRLSNAAGYQVTISPVLENFAQGSEYQDASRFNQLLEKAIQEHPEQYFWIHKRFKTRHPNEVFSYYPI